MKALLPFDVSLRQPNMLLSILCAHAALLAWVATERSPPVARTPESRLLVFDVAGAPAEPASVVQAVVKPVPADAPLPVVYVPAPPPPLLIVAPAPPPAALDAPMAGSCDLTDTVQAAILQDQAARSALLGLPPSARSVANAVMLWDGHWVAGATPVAQDTLARIRAVVLATVIAASEDCRNAVQAGPRILAVPGPPDIVLALGSGRWRWNDLQADEAPALPGRTAYAEPSRQIMFQK